MTKKRANGVKLNEVFETLKLAITAKNEEQKNLLKVIKENTITFVRGPAGTGKTFLSVTYALQQLLKSKTARIVFTRPVIEAAGERLGFLPGEVHHKIEPYMAPIFESLLKMIPSETLSRLTKKNGHGSLVRVLPLAYMRGITFEHCYVICDEMQNSTPEQMRMLLTRVGEDCKVVVCGDTRQTDVEGRNGLEDAFELLEGIPDLGFVEFTAACIVRHPLVQKIENKYETRERSRKEKRHGS